MIVCLDTNFLIDLLYNSPSAIEKARTLDKNRIAISVISLYELYFNAFRKNTKRLLKDVEILSKSYDVITVDQEVVRISGEIQANLLDMGERIPVLDILIAGTAIKSDARLVTKDDHLLKLGKLLGAAYKLEVESW